jgi:hypothetical protein
MELIPQVILSPYVIGVTIVITIYGSIISAVARNREQMPRAPKMRKPIKLKKFTLDKPGLKKNADISDLGLD